MKQKYFTIAEVSQHLRITAHTARYYERAGLIDVDRDDAGHRIYDEKTLGRLDFLVRMRTSGMGISDLQRYIDLVRQGDSTRAERLQIMIAQRERIRAQIDELTRSLQATDFKIATYGGDLGAAFSTTANHDTTTLQEI